MCYGKFDTGGSVECERKLSMVRDWVSSEQLAKRSEICMKLTLNNLTSIVIYQCWGPKI